MTGMRQAASGGRVRHFPPSNRAAVAAVVCGVVALVVGIVPLFIGLVLSVVPALLAVLLGIAGVVRGARTGHRLAAAIVGLALGALTVVLWFHGYGTAW